MLLGSHYKLEFIAINALLIAVYSENWLDIKYKPWQMFSVSILYWKKVLRVFV